MGTLFLVPKLGTHCEVKMEQKKSIDVRFRLDGNLHRQLKEKSEKEERSMNYLMNKAVELLLNQESAKA